MVKQAGQAGTSGTFYAKIDHSRSLFNGLISPGSSGSGASSSTTARANACFAGPMIEETDEISCDTPLVGKASYVIYSPEGQGHDRVVTVSTRESKV